ncbi:MAG: hypothetical protein CMO36_02535 [Verrucomicrobiaceae bacterium]|nr:hypothetical protein [Verrucomicrobiaceae bacterium]
MGSILSRTGRTGRVTTYNLGGSGGRATYDGMDGRYDIPGGNIQDNLGMLSRLQANSDSLAGAISQAQDLDAAKTFQDNVDYAVNNPAEITQEDYDKFDAQIGDIQRAPLNADQKKAAISQVLTNAGIYHDVASLDIIGKGSDAGGLLSKRIKIVEKTDAGGTDAASSNTDDLAAITNDDDALSADDLSDNIDTSITSDAAGADAAIATLSSMGNSVDSAEEYSWVYDAATDSFQEGYFQEDANGNVTRILTGDAIEKGQVFGADGKVFKDGETAVIMPRVGAKNGGYFLEHGGQDKFTSEKDKNDAWSAVRNDVLAGNIDFSVVHKKAADIFGKGSIEANKAVMDAAKDIKKKNDDAAAESIAKQQAALAKAAGQQISDGNTDTGLQAGAAAASGQLANDNVAGVNPASNVPGGAGAGAAVGGVVGGNVSKSGVVGNQEVKTTSDPQKNPDGGTGIGVGTGIGSGSGPGDGEKKELLNQVASSRPVNDSIFRTDLERIRLDPTGLMSRLFI